MYAYFNFSKWCGKWYKNGVADDWMADETQPPQCQWQTVQLCQPHFTSDGWYIFSHSQGRFGTFFSKSFDQLLEADGEDTSLVFSNTPSLLGIIAWESFIWLNQISLEDSNQSLKGILQWGRKRWWWQESPRTQPCSPFYRASIVYLLYIFLISATTLKHPKHDVELLEPRLQCSVHILDTSHHPHAGRWRCTLPCSPWRSSRKVPLPCFRSHEIDRRLSSHYIHKFKHIGNLESFIWLQIARIILLDLNLHIWPL